MIEWLKAKSHWLLLALCSLIGLSWVTKRIKGEGPATVPRLPMDDGGAALSKAVIHHDNQNEKRIDDLETEVQDSEKDLRKAKDDDTPLTDAELNDRFDDLGF